MDGNRIRSPLRGLMVCFILLILMVCTSLLFGCNLPNPQPCSVDYLISKINDANATPFTADVIDLAAGCTYELKQVNNLLAGANGLPAIVSPIVIKGNNAVIMHSSNASERFRLFYINPIGSLEIREVTLMGGYAYNPEDPNNFMTNSGGAILNQGHLRVIDSLILENTGIGGGGIYNQNQMSLSGVTIDSNHASNAQGGAGLHNRGIGTIENSTISHNGLFEIQDGIFNSGTLEMTNSTVSRNGMSGIDNEGTLTINHVTIAFNERSALVSCGDLYTSNSIFAQPPGTSGCGCNTVYPTFPNIDTTGTCGGLQVNIADIRLVPLADNGGPTQTHALLPGSVAIDIVERLCLPTDQRGATRPFGSQCDAGAYEFTGAAVPMLAATDTPTLQACTFTAAVALNCRSSPGVNVYPTVDFLKPGQSVPVVGQSLDGEYLYVMGPNNGVTCSVPAGSDYGKIGGDCGQLAVMTPLPLLIIPSLESGGDISQAGCLVGAFSRPPVCVSPCPPGASPGTACSP